METARVSRHMRSAAAVGKPRICIVSHAAWGAVSGGRSGHAGGVEYQTALTAQWLAAHQFDVTLVVWSEGQPADVQVNGVRVLSVCRPDQGLPVLRFVHPRWTSLVRALHAADADLYYQNCGEYVTGQVARWCRTHRRHFVFSVASDPECDPRLPAMRSMRERVLYRYGLRRADRIIVQTRQQQTMLRQGFDLESVVLPMPCAAPADHFVAGNAETPPRFVWVGRISPEKDPDRLISLARALPDFRFDLAGPASTDWARQVIARAALPNLRILGRVARADMPGVYRGATALICTSLFEGFPNTFLEAWSHAVPVITTIDPDNLVASFGLGAVAGGTDDLVRCTRRLASDRGAWLAASAQAREYYESHHTPDKALTRFADEFLDVCRRPAAIAAADTSVARTMEAERCRR